MEIHISRQTPTSYGSSNLFGPIQDRLEVKLKERDYGSAIELISILIALPAKLGKLTGEEKREFGARPRKRLTRKSKKMRIDCLSRCCTADDEEDRNYSIKLTNDAVPDVIDAFELMRDAVKPTDDFDVQRLLSDVRAILKPRFTKKEAEENDRLLRAELERDFDEELEQQLANPELTRSIATFEITQPLDQPEPTDFDWLQFRNETCCISAWYHLLIGGKLRGFSPRLFIDFADKKSEHRMVAVARLSLPFDFEDYFRCRGVEQKRRTAETLRDGLAWMADSWGEDPAPVLQAFEQMELAGFEFQGELKKRFSSPNKKLTARIEFDYGLDGADLVAAFTKRGGRAIIARRPIGKCPPHPWLLNVLHNCFRWKGNTLQVDFVDFHGSVNTKSVV